MTNGNAEDDFLAEERRELLPRLIPPIVHKLNNSLAVVHGVLEYGSDAPFSPELATMAAEFMKLRLLP